MTYAGQIKWYLNTRGAISGPHTLPELYRLIETGKADLQDIAQAEGLEGWMPLSEVIRRANAAAPAPNTSPGFSPQKSEEKTQASAPPTPTVVRSNYLLQHWRGELSLAVSYWVNNFVVSLALGAAIGALSTTDALQSGSPRFAVAWLTGAILVGLAVGLWQLVGTWRSADKHTSRGGRKFWSVAVKVLLCLGLLRGAVELGTAGMTAMNAWRHVATLQELPPPEFLLLRGGTEVEFRGGIRPGTAAQLREALGRAPQARIIHLSSPGGDLTEGHNMAALVRARGMDTYVRSSCLSACARVFLAGRNRLLKEGARLGFHAPTPVASGIEGARIVEAERRAMVTSGLPEWFVTRAFMARGSEMWFPTVDELSAARVVTLVTDGRHLSPGRPASLQNQTEVENTLRAGVLGAALETANAGAFRDLASRLRAIHDDGGTVNDAMAVVERTVAPFFAESLKKLPDRQMVGAIRVIVDTARALGARDSRVCRDWLMRRPGEPLPDVAALLTQQQQQAFTQAMADVIVAAADPRQRAVPPQREPPQLQGVIRRLDARLPRGQMAFFSAPDGTQIPPGAVCTAVIELYTEILRLPEREAGPVLRFLLASV